MPEKHDLSEALKEEKQILQSSRDITEISDEERDTLRSLLKEGLL